MVAANGGSVFLYVTGHQPGRKVASPPFGSFQFLLDLLTDHEPDGKWPKIASIRNVLWCNRLLIIDGGGSWKGDYQTSYSPSVRTAKAGNRKRRLLRWLLASDRGFG